MDFGQQYHSESSARQLWSYAVASLSIICCFAAASFPVPLLSVWSKTLQLSTLEVSLTVISYVAGCILTLLFLARMSDAIGRRAALIPAQLLGIASCLILMAPDSAVSLFIGRLLQGLYCGIIISSAMPWAVDMAPKNHRWLGSAISVAGPSLGMIVGTLSCGVLAQTGLVTVGGLFEFLAVVMAVLLFAVLTATEKAIPNRPKLITSLKPILTVPSRFRNRFVTACIVFVGVWALTCYFQGFSSHVADLVFARSTMPIVMAALIYVSLIFPNACGGMLFGKMDSKKVLLWLTLVFCASGCLLFLAVAANWVYVSMICLPVCGVTGGGLCSVTLHRLIHDTQAQERASLISCLFLIGDIGTGVPSFLIGKFISPGNAWGSANIFAGWFLLTLILTLLSVLGDKDKV